MRIGWKILVATLAVAGVAGWLAVDRPSRARALSAWHQLSGSSLHAGEAPSKAWIDSPGETKPSLPRGVVELTDEQVEAIGLKTTTVKNQTEPVILRLTGVTDYDPATLTLIRSMFDCRIDKVLVSFGSVVKVGDPLLEVFSTDLAQAKSDYETARSQWTRDKKVLDYKAPLAKSETIPRKELIEIENDESKSHLQMKLAKDKLLVYGLTEKEVEDVEKEDGVQKARLILRSRADGIVLKRSVVPGNYYDAKDELMQIAPLDHLWVRGSVSELDADKVEIGQTLRIIFPYSDQTITDEVEGIDKAIDPETRSAKFRASIPNPDKRFKAGMFVRVLLEVPPKPGETVIPRESMVSVDRLDFVFVQQPGPGHRFERRKILVSKETSDWVIVARATTEHAGLKIGETLAVTGSLILEQMYEDRLTVEGKTSSERPRDDESFGRPEKSMTIKSH
ncbi:MAG: efflux RND transporter periplasmic adaptor subunit [Paludisphaera borealis]|uniref:efflux RND transporter periplasmic adaptor subunit n=1 Tax=Paludisphaera borealis TaxID=1387353 RepID=UPI002840B72F|nr:efflux RND transporter periplasmic adaptor subunit [Paludisphaera borealis]MDR3620428.1 efflux RND transporter periplasmic adaptor subunit [Paludisphaera borealis]